MKTEKIISFLCAMIIFFTTVCPSISLATSEIANTVNKENAISIIDTKEKNENNITNEVEISNKETSNKISENTVDNSIENNSNLITNKFDKAKNITTKKEYDKLIEKKMIINGKEELIVMKDTDDINNIKNFKVRSLNGTKLYVLHNASYISTTVHHREDGYGILIRKISTHSDYSDVKQAFCIEMGVDISSGVYDGDIIDYKDFTEKNLETAYNVAYTGWYSVYGDTVIDGSATSEMKKIYVFTQQLVWEVLGYEPGTFLDSALQNEYINWRENILNEINDMSKLVGFNGDTITLNIGETYTLTDTNRQITILSNGFCNARRHFV